MSGMNPFNLDARSVLVDKLGEDPARFQTSNLIFKNGRGLNAVFEIGKLRAELLDFAKNPEIAKNVLGPVRPKQPDISKLSEEEAAIEIQNYKDLLGLYELEKKALSMQVPTADMFAIEQYLKPFEDAMHATPAVKGKRFHAFTKPVEEPQTGFLGMGKNKSQSM